MDALVIDCSQLEKTLSAIFSKTTAGIVVSGFPGCGKTRTIRKLLKSEQRLFVRWTDFLDKGKDKMLAKIKDFATTGSSLRKWIVLDSIGDAMDEDVGHLVAWLLERGSCRFAVLTDRILATIPVVCLHAALSICVKPQPKEFPREVIGLFSCHREQVMTNLTMLISLGTTPGGILEHASQFASQAHPELLPKVTEAQINCKTSPWDVNDLALFFVQIRK